LPRKNQLSLQCVHTWANTIKTVDRPVVASSPNRKQNPIKKKKKFDEFLKKKMEK
jgi:hypothetical protein